MNKKAVVAGHICIDITPQIPRQSSDRIQDILAPGSLVSVGEADIHTGGCVANTGLAMKILGADVTLIGKVGNDAFGDIIINSLGEYDAAGGIIKAEGRSTSYSVVLAVPGIDRIFLHNPGANDTFCPDDLPMDMISRAALFHFGYPPTMRCMYENNGRELVRIMRMVREAGTATSMDLAAVDPDTDAGRADWRAILTATLPYVDIFVPSIEELMFMLDRPRYDRIRRDNPDCDRTNIMSISEDIEPLGRMCLDMGAGIVLIKCGAKGMYYCTAGMDCIEQISDRLILDHSLWADRKGFEYSFRPEKIVSGTGAGDTSIAAFLTSILSGNPLEKSVRYATATGACCVEAVDALSGLKSFDELDKKMARGWPQNHETPEGI